MGSFYSTLNHNERIYAPMELKTFKSALAHFLKSEFPQAGGDMIIDLMTDKIRQLIDAYYPKSERLAMGQMLWFAIDEKETTGYGKAMHKTKIKPVILTVVHPDDIYARKKGVSTVLLKKTIIARLYRETKEQGAVLAESDLSLILNISLATVSKHTLNYEKQFHVSLPRRGTIHDLGRSLSHKKQICKKRNIDRKTIRQISLETNHTPAAVTRYTTDLERVQYCLNKKLKIKDISFVTNLSSSLTLEYVNLIDEIEQIKRKQKEDENNLPF